MSDGKIYISIAVVLDVAVVVVPLQRSWSKRNWWWTTRYARRALSSFTRIDEWQSEVPLKLVGDNVSNNQRAGDYFKRELHTGQTHVNTQIDTHTLTYRESILFVALLRSRSYYVCMYCKLKSNWNRMRGLASRKHLKLNYLHIYLWQVNQN